MEQARFKYPQICKHFSGEDWDNSLQRYCQEKYFTSNTKTAQAHH